MNGYDAWKTTPPWNKPADCPHASEDDCTCDDYVAKCDVCGTTDKPLMGSPETGDQFCEGCLGDINANAAFDANPLGFRALRAIIDFHQSQPFGEMLRDFSFSFGNGMIHFFAFENHIRVSTLHAMTPNQWKLTNLGWSVVLGPGLGTITPEAELPEPIRIALEEVIDLEAERGVRS